MSLCPTSLARPGFTAIEFIIAAIPILLLSLSAYEVSLWYQHRHMLNLAMLEAARQGSVQHAHPQAIQAAFEQAITPLFVPTGAYNSAASRRDAYFNRIQAQAGASWRILIEDPKPEHYLDFKRPDLMIAQRTGMDAIDNNFQKEQHQRKSSGLFSAQTIYQANTLTLSIIYPYKPKVPGMSTLFRQLGRFQSDAFSAALMRQAGVLPIRQHVAISMQSHPVMWSRHQAKNVSYPHQSSTPSVSSQGQPNADTCVSIWCNPSTRADSNGSLQLPSSAPPSLPTTKNSSPPPKTPTGSTSSSPSTAETTTQQTQSGATGNNSTRPSQDPGTNNHAHLPPTEQAPNIQKNMTEPISQNQDEELCGVSLCCH